VAGMVDKGGRFVAASAESSCGCKDERG
jgi:hypothetical protein